MKRNKITNITTTCAFGNIYQQHTHTHTHTHTHARTHARTHAILTHRSKLVLHWLISISIQITESLLPIAVLANETSQSSLTNFSEIFFPIFATSCTWWKRARVWYFQSFNFCGVKGTEREREKERSFQKFRRHRRGRTSRKLVQV